MTSTSDVVVRRLPGLVPYLDGWQLQRDEHAAVAEGAPGRLLLLQHEAVYTAGKRTSPHERPTDGTPVVDVDRGGKITWHGPGQLVGYPLVRLPDPIDVVAYVRLLEGALIEVCAGLGLATERVEGRSGVWVRGDGSPGPTGPDRKVAAIGIRVARGVTMHGFALNCDCDLSWAADRPLRHPGRRGDVPQRRAGPAGHGGRGRRPGRARGPRGPALDPADTARRLTADRRAAGRLPADRLAAQASRSAVETAATDGVPASWATAPRARPRMRRSPERRTASQASHTDPPPTSRPANTSMT
jgi:lipoyl(octanoyl) transferase